MTGLRGELEADGMFKEDLETMAWFEEFRNNHHFTSYGDNRTPVTYDIPLLAVTYFCVVLSIATLIATLGIRGRERWSSALRACYAVGIGSIILACLVGHGWQTGEVYIKSPYVYRTNAPFYGKVGINVALHAANVTLSGCYYKGAAKPGSVYYAESMPWSDFGHETESYNHYLHRGLPEPILKVMEFLTVDGGGLRWGRSFHSAGHYASVLLWTSFAFWIITNVLLFSVVCYGAYMFFLTGLTMVLASVAYHACQNEQPLVISFGDADLKISYDWCFWLTLTAGSLTLLLGFILIVLDNFVHDSVSEFFHLEKLSDDETFEYDERRGSSSNILMDRRGSIVPPQGDRRGSIFLEPGRRPSWYTDNLKKSMHFVPGNMTGFANKSFEFDPSSSKLNPLYNVEESTKGHNYANNDVTIEMERVCLDSEICISSKKPSLATLKEHRENHANERLYSSAGAKQKGNDGYEDEKRHFTLGGENIVVNNPGILKSSTPTSGLSRHASNDSIGFESSSDIPVKKEITIKAEAYSRQSSHQSSSSGGATSVDSGRGVTFDTNDLLGQTDSKGVSKRSNDIAKSEVNLDVGCS